jgi:hypothetical protein
VSYEKPKLKEWEEIVSLQGIAALCSAHLHCPVHKVTAYYTLQIQHPSSLPVSVSWSTHTHRHILIVVISSKYYCIFRLVLYLPYKEGNSYILGGQCYSFWFFVCFLRGCRNEYIEHTLLCLGFALHGWSGNMTGSLFVEKMSCCDCCGLKSVEELCHPPTGLEPMPHNSVALMAQYLNVRQRKLALFTIIQTVHILQHESADTGSLPMEDFFKHNLNYF